MKSLVVLHLLALYVMSESTAAGEEDKNCHAFCAFGLKVPGCHCSSLMSVGYDSDFGKFPLTTLKPEYTTDICDYLCYIQMGGDACQCSKPGVPGRK